MLLNGSKFLKTYLLIENSKRSEFHLQEREKQAPAVAQNCDGRFSHRLLIRHERVPTAGARTQNAVTNDAKNFQYLKLSNWFWFLDDNFPSHMTCTSAVETGY